MSSSLLSGIPTRMIRRGKDSLEVANSSTKLFITEIYKLQKHSLSPLSPPTRGGEISVFIDVQLSVCKFLLLKA